MKTSSENHSIVHTISQPYLWDASPDIPLHRHIVTIDKGNEQNGNGWENYSIGCQEILMYSSRKGKPNKFFSRYNKTRISSTKASAWPLVGVKKVILRFLRSRLTNK